MRSAHQSSTTGGGSLLGSLYNTSSFGKSAHVILDSTHLAFGTPHPRDPPERLEIPTTRVEWERTWNEYSQRCQKGLLAGRGPFNTRIPMPSIESDRVQSTENNPQTRRRNIPFVVLRSVLAPDTELYLVLIILGTCRRKSGTMPVHTQNIDRRTPSKSS